VAFGLTTQGGENRRPEGIRFATAQREGATKSKQIKKKKMEQDGRNVGRPQKSWPSIVGHVGAIKKESSKRRKNQSSLLDLRQGGKRGGRGRVCRGLRVELRSGNPEERNFGS